MPSLGQTKPQKKEEKPESSFMFSLSELSHMERERLRAETEAARLASEAIVQQREAEERRAREEIEQRRVAAEREARDQAWREREALARVEAEKVSRIEAARIDAEAAERRHARSAELEVEKARVAAKSKNAKRSALWAVAGAALAGAAALLVQVGVVQPREDRRAADLGGQVTLMGNELEELKATSRARDEHFAEMKRDLASARDEAHRLADENAALRNVAAKPPTPAAARGPIGTTAPASTAATVAPGSVIPPGFRDCHGKINGDPSCWR